MGNFCCRGVLQIWIQVGHGLTVLTVGAGGDCSVIFFLSSIISFFFLPLSGMDGWVTCCLSPFQQNFGDDDDLKFNNASTRLVICV